MPKISVIIPNYNHAPFLRQRIDSVLSQTFQDFELIILDDNSTDNSKEIIEGYRGNARVAHIAYNETNSGSTFLQWEKGLMLAGGELVWIAESDDVMENTFLEKAVLAFTNNVSLGLFQCASRWIDEKGVVHDFDAVEDASRGYKGRDFILQKMIRGNHIYNASAVVFKKSLVSLPLSKNITRLTYCGDWIFWIKILQQSELFYLNENLNSFRTHAHNVSGGAKKKGLLFLEGIKVYGFIKKCYPESFGFFDKNDRTWAFRFASEKYSLKTNLQFIKNAINAGTLVPLYMIWFKIKFLFKPLNV
ncbi:MAG: glycosyltransferase [Daejeonella sp.]